LGTPTSGTLTNTTGFPAANLAGTALPAAIVTSSLTAVGTIATGVWNGTAIAIANGGTGQTTKSAAFNALSPITTTGDLIIGNGTNSATNLAIGTNGYVLTSNGTTATWAASGGGGGSAATATTLGTVYALQTTSGASPYLTAFGYNAAVSTTGVGNTAIGNGALSSNTTGTYSTLAGYQAGFSNVTGLQTTAFGAQALYSNTVSNNSAFGYGALYTNTTGTFNVAFGNGTAGSSLGALGSNTTGSYNTAFGNASLSSNTTGAQNVAVGYQAFYSETTGFGNTSLGTYAGTSCTTGNYNVCIGRYAGGSTLTTGTYNTLIGFGSDTSASGSTGQVVIGTNYATGKGDNTGYFYPGGPYSVYQGNNSAAWSVTSDQRLKKNIVDNNVGLEKIAQIQVRNFEYRTEDEVTDLPKNQAIKKDGIQLGAIAQELQQILPDCVKTESTGVMSLNTDNIMWHMINAIKELNAEIQSLKAKVGV
jgi:hypothetical protein